VTWGHKAAGPEKFPENQDSWVGEGTGSLVVNFTTVDCPFFFALKVLLRAIKKQLLAGQAKGARCMRCHAIKILFYVCVFSIVTATTSQAKDVTLQWDPEADSSVIGYRVYYNADSANLPFSGTGAVQGTSPIDVNNLTSSTVNGLDPNSSYYFTVTAYNASGAESSYSNIVNVSESVPPVVSITSPVPNATINGTVSVTVSATDNVGVTKVEFYLNGILQTTDTSIPYLYSLNTSSLASGTYSLMAKAYDAAGNIGQSSAVSVTVVNDTTAPTVSLTSPVTNATLSGITALSAAASDNIGVSKVELYKNGVLLFVTNVAPYSYNWNTTTEANGSYTLIAKAYDNAGNVAQSANVPVTVNNPTTDVTSPTVNVTAPANNATVSGTVSITASASDNVAVSKVEFYVNSVLAATYTVSPFTYSWNTTLAANGSYTLSAKAYDTTGNSGQSSAVTIKVNNPLVPAGSIWSGTTVPGVIDAGPDTPVELGVKFRSDSSGYITGIRFYKASTNTGTHIGNLWDNTGKLLATATFVSETASGWQQVNFTKPVAIAANTVYVASYHANAGHYSDDQKYFSGKGVDNPPLHALADGISGYSGIYTYGSTSNFPNKGWNSSNYWVDVAFASTPPADSTSPVVAISSPAANATVNGTVTVSVSATDNVGVSRVEFYVNNSLQATDTASPYSFSWNTASLANGPYTLSAKAYDAAGNVGQATVVTATVNNPVADTTVPVVSVVAPANNSTVSGTVSVSVAASDNVGVSKVEFYVNGALQATDTASPYSFSWNTASVVNGVYSVIAKAYDSAGNIGTSNITTTVSNQAATAATYSIWNAATVPSVVDSGPDNAVELGLKFRTDLNGFITGIRFYKASTNTGTHIASLWTTTGARLATATFSGETTSGWQQVNFTTPVAVSANTVYVASYHTNVGHYSDNQNYFASSGVDSGPLHALANGVSGANSVYAYSTTSTFPTLSYLSTNYWVDVVFKP
jgi:chitinase